MICSVVIGEMKNFTYVIMDFAKPLLPYKYIPSYRETEEDFWSYLSTMCYVYCMQLVFNHLSQIYNSVLNREIVPVSVNPKKQK